MRIYIYFVRIYSKFL